MIANRAQKYFDRSVTAIHEGKHERGQKWLKIAGFYGYPTGLIHYQQAIVALEQLNLTDALRLFHSYMSLTNRIDENVYYYLGEIYYFLGNKDEACRYFKKSFDRAANLLIQCKSLVYLDKLNFYSSEKVNQLTEHKFDYLLSVESHDMDQKRINALMASLRGDYNLSIDLLTELIEAKPNVRELYKELCECYLRSKRYNAIIDLLQDKTYLYKRDKTLLFTLAKAYYLSNLFSEARQALLFLIKALPGNAKLYFNLGNIYYKLKQYNRSSKCYVKAIQSDPQFYICHYNIGVLYHKTGMLDLGEEYYHKIFDTDHLYYPVHYNLGVLYYQKKQYFDSLNAFQTADHINRQDGRARHNFDTIKSIKLIDPDTKVEQKVLSLVNIYLIVAVGLLVLLFIFFS